MPREKFQTLTEQMFYILICLQNECCGIDIMEMVKKMTNGRVNVGPGTLYNLLEQFMDERIIAFTKSVGKKRSYVITDKGRELLEKEYNRLLSQVTDYKKYMKGE
ncbi:MAG: helix-turn-helix transcriptional regulator [Oscillospiraceae bacterium]|nr:helix-turn-helix transcriptional regulator [Oscillospiraceae bacterium]